jgi:glutamate transport system permease protein
VNFILTSLASWLEQVVRRGKRTTGAVVGAAAIEDLSAGAAGGASGMAAGATGPAGAPGGGDPGGGGAGGDGGGGRLP